jgi:hypothetical protein
MACERGSVREPEFISKMAAEGARSETAKFVRDEAIPYYFAPLTPDPSDRWESTLRADPWDLEDITAKFWEQQGWAEPPTKDPVTVPSDPTLLQYALWLDRQRLPQR